MAGPWARARQRIRFVRDEVHVAPGSTVAPDVVIGRRTNINARSQLEACAIGSYCAIGGLLSARGRSRVLGALGMEEEVRPITVGHAVWIGHSVVIEPGVTIGNGAIVGAGSVVTESVPAYAIVAGNPARVLRMRYPAPVVDELERVAWWEWDDDRLQRSRALFERDLSRAEAAEVALLATKPD